MRDQGGKYAFRERRTCRNQLGQTLPPATRITDVQTCPAVNPGGAPHVGGPVIGPGVPTVRIGGLPASVMGDMATCAGPPATVTSGSGTVKIGGKPAVRQGDATSHGGQIASGLPNVLIGG